MRGLTFLPDNRTILSAFEWIGIPTFLISCLGMYHFPLFFGWSLDLRRDPNIVPPRPLQNFLHVSHLLPFLDLLYFLHSFPHHGLLELQLSELFEVNVQAEILALIYLQIPHSIFSAFPYFFIILTLLFLFNRIGILVHLFLNFDGRFSVELQAILAFSLSCFFLLFILAALILLLLLGEHFFHIC